MAEQKIGQKTFKVEPILATSAIHLQVRLMKVVGGAVDRLPTILRGQGEAASFETKLASDAAAVSAFVDIFTAADPDTFTTLIKDLAELAQVKRPSGTWDQVDLDSEFTTDLGKVIPLVIFVLREQFGSFFSEALAAGAQRLRAAGSTENRSPA